MASRGVNTCKSSGPPCEYDLYKKGMSIPEVNKLTGIPLSTLRNRFKKEGILRSRHEGILIAKDKGLLGSGLRGKTRVFSSEWRRNISKGKTGTGKGYRVASNGYIEFTAGPHKNRSMHVVLMELFIGRPLLPWECVHHIDHNKLNNSISNLMLMTRVEHSRLHAKSRFQPRDNKGRFINGN